jgi:hypothetical protein
MPHGEGAGFREIQTHPRSPPAQANTRVCTGAPPQLAPHSQLHLLSQPQVLLQPLFHVPLRTRENSERARETVQAAQTNSNLDGPSPTGANIAAQHTVFDLAITWQAVHIKGRFGRYLLEMHPRPSLLPIEHRGAVQGLLQAPERLQHTDNQERCPVLKIPANPQLASVNTANAKRKAHLCVTGHQLRWGALGKRGGCSALRSPVHGHTNRAGHTRCRSLCHRRSTHRAADGYKHATCTRPWTTCVRAHTRTTP